MTQDFLTGIQEGNFTAVSHILQQSENDANAFSRLLECRNEDEWTGLDIACYEGHHKIADLILKKLKATDLTFPLLLALGRKHYEIVNLLLRHKDSSLLTTAKSSQEDPVLAALTMENKALVQLLQDIMHADDLLFYVGQAAVSMSQQQIQICFLWSLDQGLHSLLAALLKAVLRSDDGKAIAAASCNSRYTSTDMLQCPKHILCVVLKQFLSRHGKKEGVEKESDRLLKIEVAKHGRKEGVKEADRSVKIDVSRHGKKERVKEADRIIKIEDTVQKLSTRSNDAKTVVSRRTEATHDETSPYQDSIVKMIEILGADVRFNPSSSDEEEDGNSLLHLAVMSGHPEIVSALLDLEADFDTMSRNKAGFTPIEMTDNDELIGLIVRDKRFISPHDVSLKLGKTILRHMCHIDVDDEDLHAKVESFFISEIDPEDYGEELTAADVARHDYIIWWLLKVRRSSINLGPISRFFDALLAGQAKDREMEERNESFLHVFARTGFDRAINHAMKRYDPNQELHQKICPDLSVLYVQANKRRSLPCMEAAKHNQCDALLLLLQPMLTLSLDKSNEEARKVLNRFVHHEDLENHTLLFLVSCHKRNLFLAHSIILQLECACHNEDSREIQECLQKKLGSNNMSKKALHTVQSRYPGTCKRSLKFVVLVLLLLVVPLVFFLGDITTDALLLRDYHREMWNETVLQQQEEAYGKCQSNVTMDCFMTVPTAGTKFWISASIIALPFLFYMVEVVMYFRLFRNDRKKRKNREKKTKRFQKYIQYKESLTFYVKTTCYLYTLLCPLIYVVVWLTWPLRVFLFNTFHSIRVEASDSHKKIDYYSKSHRTFQVLSSRAHVIEVSTESSLQPLLQLYLFLPSFINLLRKVDRLSDFRLIDLTSTGAIQLYSVVLSVFSVAYSFTAHYRRKKVNAVKTLGTLIYFSFTLCFIVSRLMAFQTFAYFFGPANFVVPATSVLCHVILMAVLHGFFEWETFYRRTSCCVTGFGIIYNCVLNGLANIFVLNTIDVFHDRIVKDDESVKGAISCQHGTWVFCTNSHCCLCRNRRSTIWRHILFDLVVALENGSMILFGFAAEVYHNDPGYKTACDIGVFIVLVLFLCGLTLKICYYSAFHMWSDLICRCCKREKDDGEMQEMEETSCSKSNMTVRNNNEESSPLMSSSTTSRKSENSAEYSAPRL